MKNEIKTSVVVDMSGNLVSQAKKYDKSVKQFSARGQRYLRSMSRVAASTGRIFESAGNKYTGMLAGLATGATVNKIVNDERRLTRLGISAGISAEKVHELKKQILDVAQTPEIRVDPGEITSAIEAILEKTGDLKFAEDNLHNIGAAIQATGAGGAAIGEVMAEFQKMGIVLKDDVLTALDILNVQGKDGAFTLANLAALGPRVMTAYSASGRTGLDAIRELGAALQVVRQGTGSAEMAATAFEAVLRTLADPKKIKDLKRYSGIELFDAEKLKKGEKVLRPINELIVEIIEKSKGDQTKLGMIFDAEAIRAFNSVAGEFKRIGVVESMKKFMDVQADGTTTLNDSARAANDVAGSLQNIYTAWEQLGDESLLGPIQKLGDITNQIGSENTQNIMKTLLIGGGVLAGGVAVGKVFRRKGGKGAAAGALGEVFGAGSPLPVYVVNMDGGIVSLGSSSSKGTRTRSPGRWQLLKNAPSLKGIAAMGTGAIGAASLPVFAAGAGGALVGSGISKLIEDTDFGNFIGRSVAHVLSLFGNDNAQASLAREKTNNDAAEKFRVAVEKMVNANAHLTLDIKGAQATVTAGETDGMDVDVYSGQIVGGNY